MVMHQEFAILAERGIGGGYGIVGALIGGAFLVGWMLFKGSQAKKDWRTCRARSGTAA